MRTYHLKKQISKKNNEGSSYTAYGDPFAFRAEIWPAGGRVQAEIYGDKLSYIINMICESLGAEAKENDGICVYVGYDEEPDYRIISIKRYEDRYPHFECELEKL